MNNKLIFMALAAAGCLAACSSPSTEVTSPDGKIKFAVDNKADGLCYSVTDAGTSIVSPSRLGFVLQGNDSVARFDVLNSVMSSHDETWETVWGESREVRDHYNQLTIEMRQKGGNEMLVNLEVRVFDDGFGYRYVFPQQGDSLVIMEELTEFIVPAASEAWAMTNHDVYYEDYYRRKPIAELDTVHTPVTIEAPGDKYLAIHEANLTDYPKMQLIGEEGGKMRARLVPWSTGVAAYVVTPFATPWRTMIIGGTPGDLVTSYMMLNLNEPCAVEDASWCKPMKYIGVWWEMHLGNGTWYAGPNHGANTANVKKYIDFAAEHGIPGVLVEGWNVGWEGHWPANDHFDFTKPYPDFDIKEITDYAAEKGVTLVGHHETAAWTKNYENQLDTAFKFYTDHGVHNVKTGYV
ncbi:MAG: glycoside hydrolase family 97 N-terminal domain-containing protein, partial [Muribaculaceae bacterium]|nr:glycoside hydrolase family 97 N-terminal domain-containing protein [Muribaculaceae bacterium]